MADVNFVVWISDAEEQAGYPRSIALGRPGFPRPFQSLKTLRCLIHSLGLGFNYSSAVPDPLLYRLPLCYEITAIRGNGVALLRNIKDER